MEAPAPKDLGGGELGEFKAFLAQQEQTLEK